MSNFGLNDASLERIREVLNRCSSISSAVVFGSRAMGREKVYSDIDIALFGPVNLYELGRVRTELEELPIPQKCDVHIYDAIQSDDLRRHIDTWGKQLFSRIPTSNPVA